MGFEMYKLFFDNLLKSAVDSIEFVATISGYLYNNLTANFIIFF